MSNYFDTFFIKSLHEFFPIELETFFILYIIVIIRMKYTAQGEKQCHYFLKNCLTI